MSWLYSVSVRWISMGVEHFGKILLGANHNTWRKTCPIATFSTTRLERMAVGLWIWFLVLSPTEFYWKWSGMSAVKFIYGRYYGKWHEFYKQFLTRLCLFTWHFQHVLVGIDHLQGTFRWNSELLLANYMIIIFLPRGP